MCLGIPGRVTEVYDELGVTMGKVDFDGILKEVCLAYVPEIQVGDYTIVHVGFAITQLDEQEAQETLALFREMGALEEELNSADSWSLHTFERRSSCREVSGGIPRSGAGAAAVRRDPRTAKWPWALMEVCGGQTHSIIRNGIDQLLPDTIELIHGPGCPVCVTPLETIDRARAIAANRASSSARLATCCGCPAARRTSSGSKARAAMCVSSIRRSTRWPCRQSRQTSGLFGHRLRDHGAGQRHGRVSGQAAGIGNFSMLVSHVLVPRRSRPSSLPRQPRTGVSGRRPCVQRHGHLAYEPLVERYRVPIVVTGFEPLDILEGIRRTVEQLEAGQAVVNNAYARAVSRAGNVPAQTCY